MSTFSLMVLLVCSAQPAAAQGPSSRTAAQRSFEAGPIEGGYVFIDGEYLAPPYTVAETAEGITINGFLLTAELPIGSGPGSGRFSFGGRSGRGGPQGPLGSRVGAGPPFAGRQGQIAYWLRSEAALLAFQARPLLIISSATDLLELFGLLVKPDPQSQAFKHLLSTLPEAEDRELFSDWLSTYRAPDDLLQRITPVVEAAAAAESAAKTQIAAVRRIDRFSYPLTVVGMVLAVLASGHLLTWLPAREPEETPAGPQAEVLRAALISVALVFFLSALDLVWTIMAAQAGQMRELNPLGNGLINDPQLLVAFKAASTLISCCLLAALRRYRIARLAAWWMCLVCTILTFRWLTFNSMFLGT